MKFFLVILFSVGIYFINTPSILSNESADNNLFSNTEWKITSIENNPIPKNINMTMSFGTLEKQPNGNTIARVSGFSGCNRFMGNYYIEQNKNVPPKFGFSSFVTTRMACMDSKNSDFEYRFLKAIEFVATYIYKNNKVFLQKINGEVVITLEPITK